MTTITLEAFEQEAEALDDVLTALDEADFARTTNCPPWTVKDLVVHIAQALPTRPPERTSRPLELREPADFYRRPERFESGYHDEIADRAVEQAATFESGRAAAEWLGQRWRGCVAYWREVDLSMPVDAPQGVCTLETAIVTRVVSHAAHGLDLAISLGREPWTTASALGVMRPVFISLLGEDPGLDDLEFFALATGRRRTESDRFPLLS